MPTTGKTEVKKFFGRLIAFSVFSVIIIGSSVLIYEFGPPEYVYMNGRWTSEYLPTYNTTRWNVLLDQHSHTIHSDGKLTPAQNIQWHIANGFNACVITDHHTIAGALEAREYARANYPDDIKVIIGEEWSNDRVHLNFLGITSAIAEIEDPTDAQIQAVITQVHDQGGLVVVNHYRSNYPSMDNLRDWGVDYFEIFNGGTFYGAQLAYCNANGLGNITGTDMHTPKSVNAWTLVNVTTFTEEAIFTELANRRTNFINITPGVNRYAIDYELNPDAEWLRLPILFGQMIEELTDEGEDAVAIVLGLAWLFGAFFIAEVLRIVKHRYWLLVNKRKATMEPVQSTGVAKKEP